MELPDGTALVATRGSGPNLHTYRADRGVVGPVAGGPEGARHVELSTANGLVACASAADTVRVALLRPDPDGTAVVWAIPEVRPSGCPRVAVWRDDAIVAWGGARHDALQALTVLRLDRGGAPAPLRLQFRRTPGEWLSDVLSGRTGSRSWRPFLTPYGALVGDTLLVDVRLAAPDGHIELISRRVLCVDLRSGAVTPTRAAPKLGFAGMVVGTSQGWLAVQRSGIWGLSLGERRWVSRGELDLPQARLHARGDAIVVVELEAPDRESRVWRVVAGP